MSGGVKKDRWTRGGVGTRAYTQGKLCWDEIGALSTSWSLGGLVNIQLCGCHDSLRTMFVSAAWQ